MTMNRHRKVAVDEVAKRYWEQYFADSGYGAAWVREIPKKVKAALGSSSRSASLRTASAAEVDIRPYANIIDSDGVSIEAFAVYPDKRVVAFVADFDHEGNLCGFDAVKA
jgi:hypothetical protein